jgi:hypothetical protein
MKRLILWILVLAFVLFQSPISIFAEAQGLAISYSASVPSNIKVLMPSGQIVTMDMDEYLKGVLPCEMSTGWPIEALKAQAVAARCYAATSHKHGAADICTTTCCQAWSGVHYADTDQAVVSTHNVVATYSGSIIQAYYFGHCDGSTRNSEAVWGGYVPYCRSVSCSCGYTSLYGHGVGMCQQGARAMANRGANYTQILTHYYTGIQVQGSNQNPIRLFQGMWIRTGPHFQSGFFDCQYTLKNYSSRTMTISPYIAGRGPNGENFDLGGIGWVNIGPNQTFNIYKSTWLRTPGRFTVFACYLDQNNVWHNINPYEPGTVGSVTINVASITNYIKVSRGIWTHLPESGAGEYFDAFFEVKNYASNNSARFQPYIWAHGPNNTNCDLGGIGEITLKPGQTVSCFRFKDKFGTTLGNYQVAASAFVGYAPSWAQWNNLPPGGSGTATITNVKISKSNLKSQIIGQNLPQTLKPGQVKQIKITIKNTSNNVTWTASNKYVLGIRGDFGSTDIILPNNSIIHPGESWTFTFNITAPIRTGSYRIVCQMKKINVAWFGPTTQRLITVWPSFWSSSKTI